MNEQLITCPHCNMKFPLSKAMKHEIEEQVKSDHQKRLEELQAEHNQQLENVKKEVANQAALKAKNEASVEIEDLKNQLKELLTKSEEFNQKELNFLKREREIAEKDKQIELDKQRFINSKTEELQTSIRESIETELKGKLSEKDLQIERLKKLAEDFKKKAEQGSMETQGESFEQELEKTLRECFPIDEFEPVPKGKRGADIIHKVKTDNLKYCGTIIWEAKNAANWSDAWVSKLKDDQRQTGGETVGIIISKVLPKSINRFGFQDGIWISDYLSAVGLATAIRTKFQELHQTKAAITGRSSIKDMIYDYITGADFRARIEATGEALRDLKSDIDRERAAMEKNWAKREKQLFRIVQNMSGVYGDMSGLGATLQKVQTLELDSGDGSDRDLLKR